MEIERKYLISQLPKDIDTYPHKTIKQGYISTSPVIRIRQIDDLFILTIKGKGLLAREEHELILTENEFINLSHKVESRIIEKTRFYIPLDPYTIELDLFHADLEGLILAEVEFDSLEDAHNFLPPTWFGEDVTHDYTYQNSNLSKKDS
jgi:CYTH domain-containing protein